MHQRKLDRPNFVFVQLFFAAVVAAASRGSGTSDTVSRLFFLGCFLTMSFCSSPVGGGAIGLGPVMSLLYTPVMSLLSGRLRIDTCSSDHLLSRVHRSLLLLMLMRQSPSSISVSCGAAIAAVVTVVPVRDLHNSLSRSQRDIVSRRG